MTSAPLRIVHIVRAPIGGIFRHICDLALAQTRAGHSVGIVCDSNSGGPFEDRMIARTAPLLELGIARFPMHRSVKLSDAMATLALYRHIRALQPDVLHGHGAKGGVFARVIGTLLRSSGSKVTRIYCPHGGSLHYDPRKLEGRIYFALERLQQRMTDALVFVSDYEYAAFETKVAKPTMPARVVYNGLAPEEFQRIRPAPDAADFLFVGMLRDLKGPDILIEALRRLKVLHGIRPTALIVGEGDDRPRYERMVADYGLADRVRFAGAVPAREAFARGRCVVVPSRAEAMPYIVLETVAAEIPLIATRVGGVPEIFGPYADRLINPADPNALADAMASAYRAPEDMQHFARKLRHCLTETFNVELMSDRITSLYQTVRGEGERERLAGIGSTSVPHIEPGNMAVQANRRSSSGRWE
ncbi:glycosyltransferase [Stappia sp. F7233]|uniref:Glycosyltransferase n=1 Tax=Stappia albiluteola TaxID=2758565 RepID=A0A839A949_9HYPH|nr:glycosyltransferase [Stappia albiluteola]MBA5776130.1 glycosyltransferase [Stappia albiluteola]